MSKSKNSFTPILLVCLYLFSGNCKAQVQNEISGQIEMHDGWKPVIYLIQPRSFSEIAADYLGQVIDSASVSNEGHFVFRNIPSDDENLLLEIAVQKTSTRFANHLTDTSPFDANYMPIILSPGNSISIEADISAFQGTFVFMNPSEENNVLMNLRDIRLMAFDLYSANELLIPEGDSMLIEKEKAYQEYLKAIMHFADTSHCVEAAATAIRWISPTGDYERFPEFIYRQCSKWQQNKSQHPYTIQLCALANKNNLPVMTGEMIPDYPLPLVNGETVNLIKMLGRKMTILDLWASWCAPCRKENTMVLGKLWSDYKNQGLQIIGYSLDNDEEPWKSAIEIDKASWIQSSHLIGDLTPFLEKLRINTIPANFILDADGKIIRKNLHGDDLIEFVNHYFGKDDKK